MIRQRSNLLILAALFVLCARVRAPSHRYLRTLNVKLMYELNIASLQSKPILPLLNSGYYRCCTFTLAKFVFLLPTATVWLSNVAAITFYLPRDVNE